MSGRAEGRPVLKLACTVATTFVVALALALAPRREIVTTIAIAAPPAQVWAVLTDTAA